MAVLFETFPSGVSRRAYSRLFTNVAATTM
jgi:hypothetical protein